MVPCTDLEEAIAQVADPFERRELEYHYSELEKELDRLYDREGDTEYWEDEVEHWKDEAQEWEEEAKAWEDKANEYKLLQQRLEKIAGKTISPNMALRALNGLLDTIGEAGVVISDSDEEDFNEMPF